MMISSNVKNPECGSKNEEEQRGKDKSPDQIEVTEQKIMVSQTQAASSGGGGEAEQENDKKPCEVEESEMRTESGGQYSDQQSIDAECEKLLRNTKKQVKQMMEEGVTKKFIHEGSSSIMSLCVAVDACLSHGLKRRALGLFKTSSSTALIQKVAKSYKNAQEILDLVSDEEKKLLEEQQQQAKKMSQQAINQQSETNANVNNSMKVQQQVTTNIPMKGSSAKLVASNIVTHRRNLWIKCALIEKKLVPIVEYLAENSSKYYEAEALMSNYLCAQILASLLVGPSALEFNRSKMNDYYQSDEPSADDLLKRHKLANPIACLCNSNEQKYHHYSTLSKSTDNNSLTNDQKLKNHHSQNNCARFRIGQDCLTFQPNDENHNNNSQKLKNTPSINKHSVSTNSQNSNTANNNNLDHNNNNSNSNNNNQRNRRRPLALKTSNIKRGTLVTDCHHYSCQEMSEHHHTRGYSIYCSPSDRPFNVSSGNTLNHPGTGRLNIMNQTSGTSSQHQAQDWPLWSPRMLHETLHQNPKSVLLYAKNNVLLETQPNETMAGYLSLHQFSSDLILKWIPNQMINGGQLISCQCSEKTLSNDMKSDDLKEEKVDGIIIEKRSEQEVPKKTSQQEQTKSTCCCNDENELHKHQHQVAVESSCLDLVVNLSVSRIVLLHCQFNILQQRQQVPALNQQQATIKRIAEQSTACSNETTTEKDCVDNNQVLDESAKNEEHSHQVEALNSNLSTSRSPNTEETLILIELDGVQRSPFKFPKGGLRLFLSCLENGLRPTKYLDPALKFDDEFNWIDPLIDQVPVQTSQLDSPALSESSTTSSSKLESILKRLPSLKRTAPKVADLSSANQNDARAHSPEHNDDSLKLQNQLPNQHPILHQITTVNYVYRIVSVQQPDWPLQTPPLSAFSMGSSSSGSMPVSEGVQQVSSTNQQRFRWSLSRLTRFSNRYKNSGSNNSTASSLSIGTRSCVNATESFPGMSMQTNEITGSITSDTTSLNPTICFDADKNVSRDSSSRDLARVEAKLNDLKVSTSDTDLLLALRTHSIQTLCESMRKQIVARAFYGWLAYCRRSRIIRTHLACLIRDDYKYYPNDQYPNNNPNHADESEDGFYKLSLGLTENRWRSLISDSGDLNENDISQLVNNFVYFGGIENCELRREVWPYLLGHYKFKDTESDKKCRDETLRESYESTGRNWIQIERIVTQRDKEILAANIAKATKTPTNSENNGLKLSEADSAGSCTDHETASNKSTKLDTNNNVTLGENDEKYGCLDSLQELPAQELEDDSDRELSVDIQENSIILGHKESDEVVDEQKDGIRKGTKDRGSKLRSSGSKREKRRRPRLESTGSVGSDASITDQFGNNVHRIDKDVQRCDRNFWYFKETKNLEKLRNIMCTYVWQNLDVGYVQGMCDLAAPFLVIFDDEILAYSCFSKLMERMVSNFPHGCAMDQHFESLKYLMQVLDPKLFEVLQDNGDYTHFYFCYRWLLLDFKRELAYEDVYRVWETIWSARQSTTDHFVIFMALAMVRYYRDIIIENNMDFTDTIKFFNEMAERHDAKKILALARDCIVELQSLIHNISI